MKKIFLISLLLLLSAALFSQPSKGRHKKKRKSVPARVAVDPAGKKLPHDVFRTIIDSVDVFTINHTTTTQHIDLPRKNFNDFTSYIRDSAAVEIPGAQTSLYYNYTLKDGRLIIGDIFSKDSTSYIVFKIYDKKY